MKMTRARPLLPSKNVDEVDLDQIMDLQIIVTVSWEQENELSVFQLFNNRRKLRRKKNLKHCSFLELRFWPLKLTAKAMKICLNFTRVRVVIIVVEDGH